MTRKPFSTIIPLLSEGDDLISAQAIHYTGEYHPVARIGARSGLIPPDDPGLCAAALCPDAPVGAALPELAAEVRALLSRIRKEESCSTPVARHLKAMQATLARHRRGPLAPAPAAHLARSLERTMLLLPGPRDVLEEVATLVARLSDTAVLSARHQSFNGFCSDLAAASNYDDLRCVAHSLTRDGTLPSDDPRPHLTNTSLERLVSPDIAQIITTLLKLHSDVRDRLAPCSQTAFAPARLRRRMNDIWDKMERGFLLADQPGLDFLRALARVAEGLGMNLHLQGRAEYRDPVDCLLSLSVLLLGRSHPIAYNLRCRAAGHDPAVRVCGPLPEPIFVLARASDRTR